MIDWEKISGGNDPPTPGASPSTTTAPAVPPPADVIVTGSSFTAPTKPVTGQGWKPLTQPETDMLDPAERMARGIDYLGYLLFGNKPGEEQYGHEAPLASTGPLRDAIAIGGQGVHSVANLQVVKPFEAAAGAVARVPLGWISGSDAAFEQYGVWAEKNDPVIYEEWQKVKAAADADVLYGGNLKADFNIELTKMLDDTLYDSQLGENPILAMHGEGVGSLGGAISHAIEGFLGFFSFKSQLALGEMGVFDPAGTNRSYDEQFRLWKEAQSPGVKGDVIGINDEQQAIFDRLAEGKIDEATARAEIERISAGGRSRIDEIGGRVDLGLEVSPIEQQAYDAYKSGTWSKLHAEQWLVSHGQGITRNMAGQLIGSVATDPLTWAALGAGSIAKAGGTGVQAAQAARVVTETARGASLAERLAAGGSNFARMASLARTQQGVYAKTAMMIGALQKSPAGPAFRATRGLIDPFAVYKPSSVQRAVIDMKNGVAVSATQRALGEFTINDMKAVGREFDKEAEVMDAIAAFSIDQANLMVAKRYVVSMLKRNLGTEMMDPLSELNKVDDVIAPAVSSSGIDSLDDLTDHALSHLHNIFTDEEMALLNGRLGAVMGGTVDDWAKRVAKMSLDQKKGWHLVTYKLAEADLDAALAAVDRTLYDGQLPLDLASLVSAETLDNVRAEQIIADLTSILKGDHPEKIAIATAEWNALQRRYPLMSSIGYATGGKEQVEKLIKQLQKELDDGNITRVGVESELAHPALKPIVDFLDKHTMPVKPGSIPMPKTFWDLPPEAQAEIVKQLQARGYVFHGSAVDPRLAGEATGEGFFTTEHFGYAEGYGRGTIKNSEEAAAGGNVYLAKAPGKRATGDLKNPHFQNKVRVKMREDLNSLKGEYKTGTLPLERAAARIEAATNEREMASAMMDYAIERSKLTDPLKVAKVESIYNRQMKEYHTRIVGKDGEQIGDVIVSDKAGRNAAKQQAEDTIRAGSGINGTFVNELLASTGVKAVRFPAENVGSVVSGATDLAPTTVFVERPSLISIDDAIRDLFPDGITAGGVHYQEPKRLWKIGFRPAEDVSWGLKEDVNTGRPMIMRDPTIRHTIASRSVPRPTDRVDVTRNYLGQIIGKKAAEKVVAPIDTGTAFINTMRDQVSGRRLVLNIQQRFEKSMFDAGVPKPLIDDIFKQARDVAGLDQTTIRGIRPGNLWDAINEAIPRDLVLKDGSHLNIHTVMDHLLTASEGDLRIMGLTSVLSQRARNIVRRIGIDPKNWGGMTTVTMYNRLRYAQPTFMIQRVADAPYYSILYGVQPVGKGAWSEANKTLQAITENMARTGTGRDFAMDMPEYATHSNFTAGIKSAMQEVGLAENRLEKIARAPDEIIAHNMVNMLNARLGDILRGTLDNLEAAAARDPELAAEMTQQANIMRQTIGELRALYSRNAGRVLNDNEVALQYLHEMIGGYRKIVTKADGTLDFDQLLHEGTMMMPSDIGKMESFRPDVMAGRLGYPDAAALRQDVSGTVQMVNGTYQKIPGEHDLAWLQEQLVTKLNAHPDVQKRVMAYFSDTWEDYWWRLAQPVEDGGLDISPHYANEAKNMIRRLAQERGMDPWEYMSGIMATNIGPEALDTAIGRFVGFLKKGEVNAEPGDWGVFFRSHLDPSAQKTLMDDWARQQSEKAAAAARAASATPGPAPGGPEIGDQIIMTDVSGAQRLYHVKSVDPKTGAVALSTNPGAGLGHVATLSRSEAGSVVKGAKEGQWTLGQITSSDRFDLAVRAAQGEADVPEILRAFDLAYQNTYAERAEREMAYAIDMQLGDAYDHFNSPELRYLLVQKLNNHLRLAEKVAAEDAPIDLNVPFSEMAKGRPGPKAATAAPAAAPEAPPMSEFVQESEFENFAKFEEEIPRSAPGRPARPPIAKLPSVFKAEEGYVYRVDRPVKMQGGMTERTGVTAGNPTSFYEGKDGVNQAIFRIKDPGDLGVGRHGAGGADRLTTRPTPPEDIEMLMADGTWKPMAPKPLGMTIDNTAETAAAEAAAAKFWDEDIIKMLEQRAASGPNPNPDVEGALQEISRLTQATLKGGTGAKNTRNTLRDLVNAIPTNQAVAWNRTHELIVQLLQQKIRWSQKDVFRLAEMQTSRSVLERSLNHPLFGLYPASYMWGKVLPESVKFLARNPYAATYTIANAQRSIAIQREYDTDFDRRMSGVDNSSGAFLADYLTPSLPWADHSARMSPMMRDLFKGKPQNIWPDELATVDPRRWIDLISRTAGEIPGAVDYALNPPEAPEWSGDLQPLTGEPGVPAAGAAETEQISGPTKAAALAPILADDLSRLQDILLRGEFREED